MRHITLLLFLLTNFILFSQIMPTTEKYTREWGTYFGDEEVKISQISEANDAIWIVGEIGENSGFLDTLVTTNAHQSIYAGGDKDGFVVKFSEEGELEYASYFGGEGTDEVYSVDVKDNKVYITGYTTSTTGIATSGSYEDTLQETFDPNGNSYGTEGSFIAQLDTSGVLQWSTYYQGNRVTYLQMIKAGNSNDFFVWGNTRSSNLATSGSFKPSIAPPYYEASSGELVAPEYPILSRFDDNGQLLWATYYGPDIDETNTLLTRAYSGLGVDSANNVYVAGISADPDYFGTPGVHQETNAGNGDIFFSKFSSAGSRTWSSYYGGDHFEWYTKLYIPRDDYIYLTGVTTSENGIATPDAFYSDYEHPEDMFGLFVAKIDLEGQRAWGAYAFNHHMHSDIIVDVDSNNDPFVYQPLGNTSGSTTQGAWQESYGGGLDDFLALKLNPSGTDIMWGSYYGGNGFENVGFSQQDNSGSLFAISDTDEMYMAGLTNSSNKIASEGSFQTENTLYNQTNFLAKFIPCPPPELPVASSPQEYSFGMTLEDLEVETLDWTGSTPIITWYEDSSGGTELPADTELEDGETYYVSQTIQGCDESGLVAVTVMACTQPGPPVGNETQGFEPGDTLGDLNVSGNNLAWYADEDRTIVLPVDTELEDGETYYVSQNVDDCESDLLAITAVEGLGLGENDRTGIRLYPNPNTGTFTVVGLPLAKNNLTLYDLQGRMIHQATTDRERYPVVLENKLATGVYVLQIEGQQQTSVLRVVVE